MSCPPHQQLPTCIYVVTEEAVPLGEHLEEKEGYSDFSLAWGLHQTIVSVSSGEVVVCYW